MKYKDIGQIDVNNDCSVSLQHTSLQRLAAMSLTFIQVSIDHMTAVTQKASS